jgi:HAE1 family hydrophobic/amphiphilic exporter-1
MIKLFSNKLKVYLILGLFGLVGIYSGLNLSVSLFPNISRPTVGLWINYVNIEKQDFIENYGYSLEKELETLRSGKTKIEDIKADFNDDGLFMRILFDWGVNAEDAYREVRAITNQWQNQLPEDTADSLQVWQWNENTGYLSISFFSKTKTIDELYNHLDPIISPELGAIQGVEQAVLFNPKRKEVRIELNPNKMAELGIYPREIRSIITAKLRSYIGGNIRSGNSKLQLNLRGVDKSIEGIRDLRFYKGEKSFLLKELADVYHADSSQRKRVFKTNGKESLILWAKPKAGANVKDVTESIIQLVKDKQASFDKDVTYKVLVDPSEFIRSSISNVFKSVAIASSLAVIVLFLFVGSFRNVSSAFIEIPFSIILAFILMDLFDMNLNLISLGGMALAAGMNVDASIVVLENIIRHFKLAQQTSNKEFSYPEKVSIIFVALKEVWLPILVSTTTTLIVFTPLIFTKDLTNAVLGDLAKAVIFSHGFACMIALIVVPLVRSQLITNESLHARPLVEGPLKKFEIFYQKSLNYFMQNIKASYMLFAGLALALILAITFVLPTIPKQLIGKPNTDWVILQLRSQTSKSIKDMENMVLKAESRALDKFGEEVRYTFMQVRRENRGMFMLRLKDKSTVKDFMKRLEAEFTSTPEIRFSVFPWNPAELPLPDPPHVQVDIKAKDNKLLNDTAQRLLTQIKENDIYKGMWSEPGLNKSEKFVLTPYVDVWNKLKTNWVQINELDLLDLSMLADKGRKIGDLYQDGRREDMVLKFNDEVKLDENGLSSFPIKIKDKIIPMSALFYLKKADSPPNTVRFNRENLVSLFAKMARGEEHKASETKAAVTKFVEKFKKENTGASIEVVDESKDLTKALEQLTKSIAISLFLIAFVLMMQFGNFYNVLTILVAIPLGVIGVIVSLYVFDSTISLNSALGIILLNGIAVNNSILLVDFSNREFKRGNDALNSILTAATQRLRPILITSLTSILGMLPIAFGMGEGGEILQPLGITVSSGLWASTLLTIMVIPLIHYRVLLKEQKKRSIGTSSYIPEQEMFQ